MYSRDPDDHYHPKPIMKPKTPVLPDAVQMSYRDALVLNAWAPVAVLAAFASRLVPAAMELDEAPRFLVALLPLPPALLYVRSLWRWMHGLDEMQRRIQVEAVSFATLVMLFVALIVDLLQIAGFVPRLRFGWEGYFALTFLFWTLGLVRANRRYQ